MNIDEGAVKQTSSFKLAKLTKGYNWEVKIYTDDIEEMKKKASEMNQWAQENYGGLED